MLKKIPAIIAFVFLCQSYVVDAQRNSLKFFSSDKDLSNSLVNHITQDSQGFIWITTQEGLNRYDGMKITIFRHRDGEPGSLKNNFSTDVFEDRRGRIWVGTLKGIQLFDRGTEQFKDVPIKRGAETLVPHVTSVIETQKGEIWIATSGRGIFRFNEDGCFFGSYVALMSQIGNDFISGIFEDRDENLWITSENNGLYYFNRTTGEIRRFFSPELTSYCDVSAVVQDQQGVIYAGILSGGIFRFDGNGFIPLFEEKEMAHLMVKSLIVKDDRLLIGTDGDGLKRLNLTTGKLESMDLTTTELDFGKAKVHALRHDRDGNLWIGVFQKGVFMLPHASSSFRYFGYQPNSLYNIGSGSVMSLWAVQSNLWVGTDNDGLYHIRRNGEVIKHYSPQSGNVPKTILSLYGDQNNQLWVGSYSSGLAVMNLTLGTCTYLNHLLYNQYEGYSNKVRTLAGDGDQKLWVGTYGSGLFEIDRASGRVSHWMSTSETKDNKPIELINNWINCLYLDSHGLLWIGTYRGVSCYDTAKNQFLQLNSLDASVFGKVVFSIYEDVNGVFWFGTTEGLIRYDMASQVVQHLTTEDGLCGNVICAILGDEDRNIWVSTFSGISRYNDQIKKFSNFYAYHGLQGNEFSGGAACTMPDGELYFGGIQGISSFYPRSIQNVSSDLNLKIINFYLYDKRILKGDRSSGHQIIDKPVMEADTFVISYYDKAFAFEFSTFDFVGPERVVFEYQLEGFNQSWMRTPPGVNRFGYTNLSPGTYRLKVRAHSDETVSSEKIFTIIIVPAWYQTWWAFSFYVLFFILIGILLYLYIKSRIRLRHARLRSEHEEMVQEAKLQFFFNISHEIRTPLTLVLNPLEKLIADKESGGKKADYILIYKNARRILRLINQMLDVRKIDKGQMEMHFSEVSIVQFIAEIMHSFNDLAINKHIRLSLVQQVNDLMVWIDVNNFDKVIYNVISNAFKFTPPDGEITVSMYVSHRSDDSDKLIIAISDSGIGVDAAESEKIFNRFYQVDAPSHGSAPGTGIGLHLSRSIVGLHHGKIYVEQPSSGIGAQFVIELPLGNKHLSPSEIIIQPVQTYASPVAMPEFVSFSESENKTIKRKTNIKILVVDDEPDIRDYLKSELGILYKVIESVNGREAYELILKEKPNIVISDVMMPEMDGITLCKKLKSNINIHHIPVILLTARYTDEDKGHGLDSGADAYIEKPFSLDILKSTIHNLIENRERLKVKFIGDSDKEKQIKPVELKSADEILLGKVVALINEKMGDPDLNVETLASHVGMSRVHMHRKLKELTNQSARDFIRSIRLKQAAELLTQKKLSVSEVAYSLGYSNLSHFSNTFKDFYGMSPTDYVANHNSSMGL